ncbi:MAG: hypothetical protein LLG40_07980 [Deltaproteobacteria bacterium]|nr:hypothetical protein [Deltaproteobacteria bacterium]
MNWIPAFAGMTDDYWIPPAFAGLWPFTPAHAGCAGMTKVVGKIATCVPSSVAIFFSEKPDTSNIIYPLPSHRVRWCRGTPCLFERGPVITSS